MTDDAEDLSLTGVVLAEVGSPGIYGLVAAHATEGRVGGDGQHHL